MPPFCWQKTHEPTTGSSFLSDYEKFGAVFYDEIVRKDSKLFDWASETEASSLRTVFLGFAGVWSVTFCVNVVTQCITSGSGLIVKTSCDSSDAAKHPHTLVFHQVSRFIKRQCTRLRPRHNNVYLVVLLCGYFIVYVFDQLV